MKFRKKSAIVEAFQWKGQIFDKWPKWAQNGSMGRSMFGNHLNIQTADGCIMAESGDWIIKEDSGFSVCNPEIFKQKYERIEE